MPPPPPVPANDPDAGIWGPLEDYEYPRYIDHIRRIKNPLIRAALRKDFRDLKPGTMETVERILEAAYEMSYKAGEVNVLQLALRVVETAEPTPDKLERELKGIKGGPPTPPPPPADEARRRS